MQTVIIISKKDFVVILQKLENTENNLGYPYYFYEGLCVNEG